MSENQDFDFTSQQELAKELGLKEALTIGVGTMIGAGIFVLPRLAIDIAGPGAFLSYLLSGIVCLITASSLAEIATGMPKSGGIYFFLSRALGSFVGTLSGLSIWISLTFSVSFYLLGLGEYLALFLPFNDIALALIAGAFFTYINYRGAKETGKTQTLIVGILVPIILVYIIWGFVNVDISLWSPMLPRGAGAVFPATAVVFVSFLGFAQIASVAEEIKEPGRNLPRAIMGSVVIVTLLYIPVILVITGVLPIPDIVAHETPVVEVARLFAGGFGAAAITFAALLATASSANASIMASSRINFAMGRDSIFPQWLNQVHTRYLTPHRPILMTGILALIMLVSADVEALSSSASVLMLLNYALINLIVIVLRKSPPEGYRPSYRSFGYPYLHIIGALASFAIIFQATTFAQITAVILMVGGVFWFLIWGRSRADIDAAVSDMRWSDILPWRAPEPELPGAGSLKSNKVVQEARLLPDNLHVLTALANPESETSLLGISSRLAKNCPGGCEITALNIMEIPDQTPLNLIQQDSEVMNEMRATQKKIMDSAWEHGRRENVIINPRVVYAHDKYKTMMNIIDKEGIDYLQLGWYGEIKLSSLRESFVNKVVRNAGCSVGVLKFRDQVNYERILVPYRGSEHAHFAVQLAFRLVEADGKIVILRVVKPGVDTERDIARAREQLQDILDENVNYEIEAVEAENVVEGIVNKASSDSFDLINIGASKEWRLKNLLFGSIPDIVAEEADSSVLMVRQQAGESSMKKVEIETEMEEEEESPEKF